MTAAQIPLILKPEHWPESDRVAWTALQTKGSIFTKSGLFAHLRESTMRKYRQAYGQWLSFLRRTDAATLSGPPAERITLERVAAYIAETEARVSPRTVAELIIPLGSIATGLAPGEEWGWLKLAGKRLYERSNPYELKDRLPITASELFHWGLQRLAHAEHATHLTPIDRATKHRQALMVALLIARPFRARAFVHLQIGRHLLAANGGFQLRLYPEDTKDARARRYPVPKLLVPHLQRHMDDFRPILLDGRRSTALWITNRGADMSEDTLCGGLVLLTKREFGFGFSAHAFRNIAATSIATYAPDQVGIIRDILGHATLNMAERHYNRASMVSASNAYQSLIAGILKEKKLPTKT